jgi:hypothetical protein
MALSQQKINKAVMDKLDQLVNVVNDIKVSVAGLPQAILNSADDRYASKASEERLEKLETRIESRTYDWLKQTVITLVGIVLALTVYSQIK